MGFNKNNFIAFEKIFKPAVHATGFKLEKVDGKPNYGSIIDDIQLKIKRAPFFICDISDGNSGAYWEAGYAIGLKKPVIYSCDEPTWLCQNELDTNTKNCSEYIIRKLKKPHFDVLHSNIVRWNSQNINEENLDQQNIQAI
jgi:hypothetical protein